MERNEKFTRVVDSAKLVLAEGAVSERLRRMAGIVLHPILFNTPLIHDPQGRSAMECIYGQYRRIALDAEIPVILCAPTWRLDRERLAASGADPELNRDAAAFMLGLRDRWDSPHSAILVAGLLGPKNDCYLPKEGLSAGDAAAFHQWQVKQLAGSGVDVLLAQTMPAIPEALGLARVMAASGLPYLISFVINRRGEVLDGTPLATAVAQLDKLLDPKPYGYMVNCAHPSFVCAETQPAALFRRLIGIQANSSSRDQTALEGSTQTLADSLAEWSAQMRGLHRIHGMKILGGCCGTDDRYLAAIVDRRQATAPLLDQGAHDEPV